MRRINLVVTHAQRDVLHATERFHSARQELSNAVKSKAPQKTLDSLKDSVVKAQRRLALSKEERKRLKALFEQVNIPEHMWKDWNPDKDPPPPPSGTAPLAHEARETRSRELHRAAVTVYM